MDYGGNWPDQNFSDPTFQDDPGPLRPNRRATSPPVTDHPVTPSGVPRLPRRLPNSVQRPLSAGPGHGSRQPLCGPAGEGSWRGARSSSWQRHAEALAMAPSLATQDRGVEEDEALSAPPSLSLLLPPPLPPPAPRRLGGRVSPLATTLRGRTASSSFLRSDPSAATATAAATQLDEGSSPLSTTRHNRGWPFDDPFSLVSLPPNIRQSPGNIRTDLAVSSINKMSTGLTDRRSTSNDVTDNIDPYLSTKQWPSSCLNSTGKYAQNKEEISSDGQWNLYNDFITENKNCGKESLPKNITNSWQYAAVVEEQSPFLQPVSRPNSGRSHSLNRPELKEPQDYEALIRNMEEVEEREINACLREELFNPSDMGDWSKDTANVRLDTVMLENFEELEQLIQEEDDDVQMALHIQDQQFPLQKGKKMGSDYLELQKPVYQGNTDCDESDDDLSPEVAAAMMHSEERGILMGSAPSRVFNALFSDCAKEPLAVFSACPIHPESVVVPTADGEIPYSPSAEDLTALASVSLGEDPPNGSVFSETLKKRGSYDAVVTEASKAYTDEQDSDPDRTSLTSLPCGIGGNLECVLDPASPPSHFSKVQLRGSIRPHWFPGYYKALPHIKGITAVCSDPGIVMEDAWWTIQTTIA